MSKKGILEKELYIFKECVTLYTFPPKSNSNLSPHLLPTSQYFNELELRKCLFSWRNSDLTAFFLSYTLETIRNTNASNTRLTNGGCVFLPGKPVNLSCQLSELDRITQKYTFTTYLLKTDELNLMIAIKIEGEYSRNIHFATTFYRNINF